MRTEILVVEGGAAILLDHYQARLDDGQWHSVQLSVESRLAVLRVDNITHSASLHTPIRTGGLGLLATACYWLVGQHCTANTKHVENLKRCKLLTSKFCLTASFTKIQG